nr:hypothetical protein [Tenacibaculum tangerinum]
MEITSKESNYSLVKGETILIPNCIHEVILTPNEKSELLEVYY